MSFKDYLIFGYSQDLSHFNQFGIKKPIMLVQKYLIYLLPGIMANLKKDAIKQDFVGG